MGIVNLIKIEIFYNILRKYPEILFKLKHFINTKAEIDININLRKEKYRIYFSLRVQLYANESSNYLRNNS